MNISYIAMNRIVEEKYKTDRKYRKEIDKLGRPLLRDGRKMTDVEILAKLASLGLHIKMEDFAALSSSFLSAEQMSLSVYERRRLKLKSFDQDWMWICLTILWERRQPERPSFEMIDDRIQEGYKKMSKGDSAAAARIWLVSWTALSSIADAGGYHDLGELDAIFRGTQFFTNWVQDLEDELGNASSVDPEFVNARIRFCEKFLERFPNEPELMIENMKRAIGESYYRLGDTARADALFRKWLDNDQKWGWGWIGWADCYSHYKPTDHNRALEILKQGLSVADLRDKHELLERLADVYEEIKEKAKAREIRKQLDTAEEVEFDEDGTVLRIRGSMNFGDEGLPLDRLPELAETLRARQMPLKVEKPGRNTPCSCGSGKKYKKCCGR